MSTASSWGVSCKRRKIKTLILPIEYDRSTASAPLEHSSVALENIFTGSEKERTPRHKHIELGGLTGTGGQRANWSCGFQKPAQTHRQTFCCLRIFCAPNFSYCLSHLQLADIWKKKLIFWSQKLLCAEILCQDFWHQIWKECYAVLWFKLTTFRAYNWLRWSIWLSRMDKWTKVCHLYLLS